MPPIPEHLPGEPPIAAPSAARLVRELLGRCVAVALLALFAAPAWPVYLLLRLALGRPPIVAPAGRFLRGLRLAATARPPAPGLPVGARLVLAACLAQRWLVVPLWGLAWHVDTLLSGRALGRVRIVAPLFEISAARSGSTQLARYLEEAPGVCAPSLLQVLFPFVWAWRLAPALRRLLPEERVRAWILGQVPPAYVERHELDPFRTDTFEVAFLWHHLGDLHQQLGPDALAAEFGPARLSPTNRAFREEDFLPFLDAIGRKTLLHAGRPRLLVKGHFLAVAPALEHRYPDARFLTVLREPKLRIRSTINFHRSQPGVAFFPPVPWGWLVRQDLPIELDYCDAELAWFRAAGGARRCVVRFDDYVRDLEGTLRTVYATCLDQPAPTVRRAHERRKRTYAVDRSLEQLGLDPAWLDARLAAYAAWCRGEATPPAPPTRTEGSSAGSHPDP